MAQAIARLVQVDANSIEEAARMILEGRLVAYPTDTVYGLGCNPLDGDAVDRLLQAKQRSKGALPVLVNSMVAGAIVLNCTSQIRMPGPRSAYWLLFFF